jgi:hypothetical protein
MYFLASIEKIRSAWFGRAILVLPLVMCCSTAAELRSHCKFSCVFCRKQRKTGVTIGGVFLSDYLPHHFLSRRY